MTKYTWIFFKTVLRTLSQPSVFVGRVVFFAVLLVIFHYLWEIIATKHGMVPFSSRDLIIYVAINQWIIVSSPHAYNTIEEDIRSGQIQYHVTRPYIYPLALFAAFYAEAITNLVVVGSICLMITSLVVGVTSINIVFLMTLFLSALMPVATIISSMMLIGFLAFWLDEVEAVYWLWDKLLLCFGGIFLPLSLYPMWMQRIGHVLPFGAILGKNTENIMSMSLTELLSNSLQLAGWLFLIWIVILLCYRKGLKIFWASGG